jgi:hypothetical protein
VGRQRFALTTDGEKKENLGSPELSPISTGTPEGFLLGIID